ncbi:MAG TPA: hypothetical protein PK140_08970 [Polyangiaceae bacterium]|jgi:hypothetical protein|nr:MAG: hypothetical protein BWY17_05078 [Deltaproteobacteria bacterium ADurb.Bin207]HQM09513.1 hypothetical protein [Polyangiaceae bacterium]
MSNWESPFIWVCFSDDCGYFQRSEAWMQEKFNVRASYRHRLDPLTGETGPLPVWSRDALKDQIVEEEEDDSVSDAGLGDKESSQ